MWAWSQSRGELYDATGALVAVGYSGHGDGVNNPACQDLPNVGPLPQGVWRLNSPRDVPGRGPYVLPLTPAATTQTFGRDGFLIHGDSVEHPDAREASHGCLILRRDVRARLWDSGDHELEVRA